MLNFQPIPISCFGDTNLHAKTEPKWDANAWVSTKALPILQIVGLKKILKLL
jgi:hypothetical protein